MKQIISKTMMLVAIGAALMSFKNFGGEGFEIFLNNKIVVQQFGNPSNAVKSLRLNQYSANDQLTIKYHHCGQVGKNRIIVIKDSQNKVLKEWRFVNTNAPASAMVCSVKDILSLAKENESVFKLYYTSSELTNERLLANIVVQNNSVARNK